MRFQDERGAALVLMSMTMVVLLGFSALVVDVAAAKVEKRQLVTTADASVLGGAQSLPLVATASDQVKRLAEQNYGIPPSAWAGCSDATPLAMQRNDLDGTSCISYDTSFNRMRVVLPTQQYTTTFAKALGKTELSLTAVAEARRRTAGAGTVQPYGLYGAAGSGDGMVCLKTATGGFAATVPPCNGPDSGNFGMLDVRQYGSEALSTYQRCGDAQQADRLKNNIAIGIDHVLALYGGTEVADYCPPPVPNPNTLTVKPGTASAFDDGIRRNTGGDIDDGRPAKLVRIPGGWPGGWPTRHVAGRDLDNKPLWEFIGDDGTLSDVPDSCRRSGFENALVDANPDNKTQLRAMLQTCVSQYNSASMANPVPGCDGACTGDLFTRNTRTEQPIDLLDIQSSPRFVYVPRFLEATPPTGNSGTVHIAGFATVFLQRLFGGCSAVSCDVDFEPGVGTTNMGNPNDSTDAVVGIVFNREMFPGSIGSNPYSVGETQYIELVR